MLKLTMYHDPAHGWLRAPVELLREYGLESAVSEYSYCSAEHVYLEEDLDAGRLLRALQAAGRLYSVRHHHTTTLSTIRRLPHYRPTPATQGA